MSKHIHAGVQHGHYNPTVITVNHANANTVCCHSSLIHLIIHLIVYVVYFFQRYNITIHLCLLDRFDDEGGLCLSAESWSLHGFMESSLTHSLTYSATDECVGLACFPVQPAKDTSIKGKVKWKIPVFITNNKGNETLIFVFISCFQHVCDLSLKGR